MPRIRCLYQGCVYREGDFCRTEEIELDPEVGCLTFTEIEDFALEEAEWEDLFEEEEGYLDDDEEDDDGYDPSEWN